jgi:hypothetical protein
VLLLVLTASIAILYGGMIVFGFGPLIIVCAVLWFVGALVVLLSLRRKPRPSYDLPLEERLVYDERLRRKVDV